MYLTNSFFASSTCKPMMLSSNATLMPRDKSIAVVFFFTLLVLGSLLLLGSNVVRAVDGNVWPKPAIPTEFASLAPDGIYYFYNVGSKMLFTQGNAYGTQASIGERGLKVKIEEQNNGARLVLWTCRCGEDLTKAIDACTDWGLTFDAVNDNVEEMKLLYGNNTRKVSATEYWDDHNVLVEDIVAAVEENE